MQATPDELLKTNFEQYQVMWNKGLFHSHSAHHLSSLASLGASDKQLKEIYDNNMRHYSEKYQPSPHEITNDNWYDSLGNPEFCSAYRDFFNRKLPTQGDWKKAFFEILLDDTKGPPLIDATLCGLIHPIIHISYAIELNSRSVACEALIMTAVCSDALHQVTTKIKPSTNGIKRALQVMKDLRLNENTPYITEPFPNASLLTYEPFLLSCYNQWQMTDDVDKAIEELFDMSVYIYAATHKPDQIDFDFVLLHLLTGTTAIRKVRPFLDESVIKMLLCAFFYLAIAVYIRQRQPKIDESLIHDYKVKEDQYNWEYVIARTLYTQLATEPHAVKVICALKDAEAKYGSKEGLYLTTAIKIVDNLNKDCTYDLLKSHEPWVGLSDATRELNVKC